VALAAKGRPPSRGGNLQQGARHLSTHDAGGVTQKDLDLARFIDAAYARLKG
jgi:hypothetical protein